MQIQPILGLYQPISTLGPLFLQILDPALGKLCPICHFAITHGEKLWIFLFLWLGLRFLARVMLSSCEFISCAHLSYPAVNAQPQKFVLFMLKHWKPWVNHLTHLSHSVSLHRQKESFLTHFWVILSVYWPTVAQMSQIIHSSFSVNNPEVQ